MNPDIKAKAQIDNLRTVASDNQGYLFYNDKKAMFEKQEYSNWFILALKVIFVSPFRYMFGYTSSVENVYGGLQKLVFETKKMLEDKVATHEEAQELLHLLERVREVTLSFLIDDKRDARLYLQEAAFIKLQEDIPTFAKPPVNNQQPNSNIKKPIDLIDNNNAKSNPPPIKEPGEQSDDAPMKRGGARGGPKPPNIKGNEGISSENSDDDKPMIRGSSGTNSPARGGRGGVRGGPASASEKKALAEQKKAEAKATLEKEVAEIQKQKTILTTQMEDVSKRKRDNQKTRIENTARLKVLNDAKANLSKQFKTLEAREKILVRDLNILQNENITLNNFIHGLMNDRKEHTKDGFVTVHKLEDDKLVGAPVTIEFFEKELKSVQSTKQDHDLSLTKQTDELQNFRKELNTFMLKNNMSDSLGLTIDQGLKEIDEINLLLKKNPIDQLRLEEEETKINKQIELLEQTEAKKLALLRPGSPVELKSSPSKGGASLDMKAIEDAAREREERKNDALTKQLSKQLSKSGLISLINKK